MHPHEAYLEGQGDLIVSGLVTGIGGGYYIDCTGLLTYYQVPLTLQVSRRFRDVSGILARVHIGVRVWGRLNYGEWKLIEASGQSLDSHCW